MSNIRLPQTYDYKKMDPTKIKAQSCGLQTVKNLQRLDFKEVSESRGESANVIDLGPFYLALVVEGLGTKNLIADQMEELTGETYYKAIAQDTVAMIVNDLLTVGADPIAVPAYFGLGDDSWLSNQKRIDALLDGWTHACNLSGASYPCGETPVLKDIIHDKTIDLAGSAVGIINPKKNLVIQSKIKVGDSIVFIESSGVQSNGISLIRKCINNLPAGYLTKMKTGQTFGAALLTPTHIYSQLNRKIFAADINVHYIVNVTGHGWRKLMRAEKAFTYEINLVPPCQEEFSLIQKMSAKDLPYMYGNYNMGVGFAYYVDKSDAPKICQIAKDLGYKSWLAGEIKDGKKQVVIKPLNIVFESTSLQLR